MLENVWFWTLPFGIWTALAAVKPLFTMGFPFAPGPPVWMWVRMIWLFAGKFWRLNTNVALAAVMVPAESRVRSRVKVPVPLPDESAFVTGGTSFAGFRAAVKVTFVGSVFDGVAGLLLPQAAARIATPTSK